MKATPNKTAQIGSRLTAKPKKDRPTTERSRAIPTTNKTIPPSLISISDNDIFSPHFHEIFIYLYFSTNSASIKISIGN